MQDLFLSFQCSPPGDVDAIEASEFKKFVIDAGQVNKRSFPELYRRAFMLGFARSAHQLVGVGAIKRPNAGYRDGVFAKAASGLSPSAFQYEMGWFHVLPTFSGNHISSRLVRELMAHLQGKSVYATSHIENYAMHAALMRHGQFVEEGVPYPSNENDVPIQLYVRP